MTDKPKKIGVLLLNVGTPDAPTPAAVKKYLAEFLSDPKVIDYPNWLWRLILHGIILKVRPKKSAELYKRVWRPEGSPLLLISNELKEKLSRAINQNENHKINIELGMRYGNPSIQQALDNLQAKQLDKLILLPLFPQFSETTTGTSIQAVEKIVSTWAVQPAIEIINDYHDSPTYIQNLAKHIQTHQSNTVAPDRLLFSFHGIPARYVRQGDRYQEQCERSAKLLAKNLGLQPHQWALAFQSRFGPEAWLQPYTDELLEEWGADPKINHVAALCPGFAIDCLETIDEIGVEGHESFTEAGGQNFTYIPALNAENLQIELLSEILQPYLNQ